MIRIVSQMRWWPIKLSNMLNLLVFSVLVTLSCLVCYTTSNHQHHLNEVEPQPEEPLSNLSPESPSISAAYTDDAYRDKPPYLRYLAGCTEDILNSISSLGCASIMPTSDNTRVICVPFMPSSSASQLSTSSSSPPPPSSAAANLDCRVLLLLPISPPRASGQVTPIGDAVELPVDTSGEQARRRKRRDRTFRNLMSGELAAGGSGRQGVGVARYMSEDELGDVRTAGSGDTGYSPEVQVPATPPQRLGDGKLRCDDEPCSLRRAQFEEDTNEAGAGAETGRDEDNYVRAIVGDNTALDSSQRLLASRRSWLPSGQVKEYADKLSAAVTERLTNGVQVEVEAARYNDLSDETQPRAFSRSTTSPSSTGSSPSRHQRDTLGKVPVLLVKLVDTQQLPFDGRGRSNGGGGNARNRFIAGSHTGAPPLLRRHSIRVHRSELMNNGTMVPPTSTLYMDLATYQSMMPSVADGEIGALLPMLSTSGGRATASTTTTTSSTSNGVAQVDLDGGMNRYAEASAMMKSQSAAPGNFDLSGSGIGSGGELPPTCNLNKYGFRASKSDALGNSCSGWVKASICYGACQTGEIADWLFPYKKSIHKVCTHGSRVRRQVQLTNCTSSEVEPSLREYHYVDATSCVCKKCSSADTVCMGSLTSATLEDNATF